MAGPSNLRMMRIEIIEMSMQQRPPNFAGVIQILLAKAGNILNTLERVGIELGQTMQEFRAALYQSQLPPQQLLDRHQELLDTQKTLQMDLRHVHDMTKLSVYLQNHHQDKDREQREQRRQQQKRQQLDSIAEIKANINGLLTMRNAAPRRQHADLDREIADAKMQLQHHNQFVMILDMLG